MSEYFYVIMPVSSDDKLASKSELLRKAAKVANITAHFPLEGKKTDSSSVANEIRDALFVFADLSFERPSCYYELGIAEAFRKPTFLVAFQGTTIHQAEGKIHYYRSLNEYKELVRQALKKVNSC